MNFVAAFVLFAVMIWAWGKPEPRPNSTEVGMVGPDTPAFRAGLKEGDVILAIDGHAFHDFDEMASYIKARPETELVLKYRRGDSVFSAILKTLRYEFEDTLGITRVEGRIGVDPVFDFHPTNLAAALRDGFSATAFVSALTFEFIWKLITRKESVTMLGGPIMIADQAGKAMRRGLPYLFNLAAFLSVNLGILNILPIPVLDGGHLVFLSIEAIRRRPIPSKKRLFWQQVGMGLLILLMVFVTYNDIARLITGG